MCTPVCADVFPERTVRLGVSGLGPVTVKPNGPPGAVLFLMILSVGNSALVNTQRTVEPLAKFEIFAVIADPAATTPVVRLPMVEPDPAVCEQETLVVLPNQPVGTVSTSDLLVPAETFEMVTVPVPPVTATGILALGVPVPTKLKVVEPAKPTVFLTRIRVAG